VTRVRSRSALAAGALAATASRRLGRGSGEVIGGKAALRIAPDLLADLAAGRISATVSGTNGKTTTTRLLAAAVGTIGPVASNAGGANMAAGVVSALAGSGATHAVLEVDEIWLPRVAPAVQPAVAVLLNLTRDQLDRSNETRRIAGMWRALGATLPATTAVANADDPLVVWAALGFARQVWVGAGQRWTADATVCPRCAQLLLRDESGAWRCTGCDLARPEPEVTAVDARTLRTADGDLALDLALPGTVNAGNAAMALAAAQVGFGVAAAPALEAMAGVVDVAGRYAIVGLAGRRARLLLAKNPAGWLEMLGLLEEAAPRPLVIHFHSRVADGRDPSWIWDVPLERLAGRTVHVSGERAEDVVVRLAYAGVAAVRHPTPEAAAEAAADVGAHLDVLATYTAFRELAVLA
jgi:UDP-N-acetylmuramyl tripeptide synthase